MNLVEKIALRVKEKGGTTYYVGGYVRDSLLGIENKDIDIEIHGLEVEIVKDILEEFGGALTYGKSFGIYSLKGENLDIALPRIEKKIGLAHRDFEVEVDPFLGVKKAIKRRDFTINGIYQNVLTKEYIDPYNGRVDLKNKIIRYIDENSFVEDPLRVLRALQFASRFDFVIDEKTIALCKTIDLKGLSKMRVEEELKKALLKGKPSIFFKYLRIMGNDIFFKEIKDINDKAIEYRDKVNQPYEYMLMSLCLKLNLRQIKSLLSRFVNKKDTIKYCLNMHKLVHLKLNSDYQINKMFFLAKDPLDLIYLRCLIDKDELYLLKKLDEYKLLMNKEFFTGGDLKKAGIKDGLSIKLGLEYARTLRLKGLEKKEAFDKTIKHLKKKGVN